MIDIVERGAVVELRLNRPPVNALNPDLLKTLAATVDEASQSGAKALVLSGSPGLFSAGLDIPTLLALDRDGLRAGLEFFFDAMQALAESRVPVVAAVTGHAPAGGAILALFCDYRVMAEGEFGIGLNEVQVGIPMPAVVAGLLTRVVGVRQAERLCVTGGLLDPVSALRVGMIDEVAALDEVVARARRWAERVVELPAAAMRMTRQRMRSDLVDLVRRHRQQDTEDLLEAWFKPEVQEPLREMVRRITKT